MRCFIFLFFLSTTACIHPTYSQEKSAETPWWLAKPMRMIQTNLREIDADLNLETYISHIHDMKATIVLFNVGGIVANYPTELPFHYRNPYMKDDLVGKVIARLHAEGIKMIGRFDFSKINETLAGKKPEWLYKSTKGEQVNYNGQVHTCVNGGYQQDYLFKILGEAIDRYPLDGVFFNMIGYVTTDYSGNYHGICQCESCKKRFSGWSGGLSLPVKEDMDDPVFRRYQAFRRETSDELFLRVHDFIKNKNRNIAICTYTPAGVDIIRTESNSALDRPLPEWDYSASDNVKTALCSCKNKAVANASVHFPDYPYRHSAVSPYLTRLRTIENILNGGWADHYVIGRLENQEDRKSLEMVKEIYRFHADNEKWFADTKPVADVCLVNPSGGGREYTGIFRILAENHVLFDVIDQRALLENADTPKPLEEYQLVVLPDASRMNDELCARLDRYVASGGKLLATGMTSTQDVEGNPLGKIRMKSLGVGRSFTFHPRTPGNYFRIHKEDKASFSNDEFRFLDIVYLDSDYLECSPEGSTREYLGFIPVGMFGPPEKSYYTTVTNKPGMFSCNYGKGRSAFIPWQIGRQYQVRSHHAHSMLLMSALEDLLKLERTVEIAASPLVEVVMREHKDGRFSWIGLINHSGQLGTAFHEPVPMQNISISISTRKPIRAVKTLKTSRDLIFSNSTSGQIGLTIPQMSDFEMVLLEM